MENLDRFQDRHFGTFSTLVARVDRNFVVVCQRCQSKGQMRLSADFIASFVCEKCAYSARHELKNYDVRARLSCKKCGRTSRHDIDAESQLITQKKIHVTCPACQQLGQAQTYRVEDRCWWSSDVVEQGVEPYLGLKLWYQCEYRGQVVWALNEEHLEYLIAYVASKLRSKPPDMQRRRTQSYALPKFIKSAKNRESLLQTLIRLKTKK